MAYLPITSFALLRAEYETDVYPEECSIGIHTGERDEADWQDLLTAFASIFGLLAFLMPPCGQARVTYSEWSSGPSFTGWHQLADKDVPGPFGTGTPTAHQLAYAFGYRQVSDTSVGIGRRRNRFYVGPLKTTVVGSDGLLTTGNRTTMFTNMQTLHDNLSAVTFTVAGGFAVVSPTELGGLPAEQFTMGLRADTIRSRNQKVPETPSFATIT